MSLKRGALIVFEGCDRVGKSTQVSHLLDALHSQGHSAQLYKFPNRSTVIGQLIDKFLKSQQSMDDRAIHLLFSANRWECVDEMLHKLKSGTTLLVDRYAYSGIVYSASKPHLSIDWCKSPDIGLPRPDAVFYLCSQKNNERDGFGDEIYERKQFQDKVRSNYELIKEDFWTILNADRTIEDIHCEILEHVKRLLNNKLSENVEQLWI